MQGYYPLNPLDYLHMAALKSMLRLLDFSSPYVFIQIYLRSFCKMETSCVKVHILKILPFSFIIQTDVSSPRELQLMAVKVEKELGPVEILVNNASLMPMTSTPHLTNDEIETILTVNLGSYIMVRDGTN